jgi:exodeoxyribonuclease V alpha subunit
MNIMELPVKNPIKLPVIVEWVRSFGGGFSLISANLNPYSERYSSELEEMVKPYINKKYNTFTVTASLPEEDSCIQGGQFIMIGNFIKHPKYGHQFKAEFFYQDVPATEDGLRSFLMTLPNIKEQRSQAIIQRFGIEGTFDVLDNDIYRLTEINGITIQRIEAIEKAWLDKKCMRELYEFLASKGLPPKLAEATYKRWGKAAKNTIENNPYKLVELRGVGFILADQFAHKILDNIPDDFRTVACMNYTIQEFIKNSNLCVPYSALKKNVISVITKCDEEQKKKTDTRKYNYLIPQCLKLNLDVFTAVKDLETNVTYVYLKEIWEQEKFIAKNLFVRSKSDHNKSECTINDLVRAEKDISKFMEQEIELDDCQKEAIQTVFDHKVSIITGAGGTGKSMLCRCIFELAQEKNLSIRMMSPTGKAAQVLGTKTGCGASTIHRSLKMRPGDDLPRENIEEDILLVDEISMCGIDTMYAMLRAMEENIWSNIVFVGDKNQLPSVSAGNFLSDIISSGCANVVTLDKIHRQSENSYISLLANEISKGKVVEIPDNAVDINWHTLVVDTFHEDILKFIDKYLEQGNYIDDLQIISPMKKGSCGVFKINEIIQEKMANLNGTLEAVLQRNFLKFHVGDRVIQIENNYDKMIFNGDMGVITELGEKIVDPLKTDQKEKFITVNFYGDEISFFGDEIDQLHLAWCITVHKFQGSQAPNIVFIMASEAQIMMSKELVYTAFTRAEKKLDIFGHVNMLKLAPTRSVIRKRYTNFTRIVESLQKNKRILQVLAKK